jgi:hypothetical protein
MHATFISFMKMWQQNIHPYWIEWMCIFSDDMSTAEPIAVAARSKAWTLFAHSNTGIVGQIPHKAWMSVCVYSLYVLFCV